MLAKVNGTEVYYEESGEGPPLLLLHGNGEDHTIFDKLIPLLAGRWHVYALDTRGHGRSAKVAEYHYADMMEDVAAFIREQNLAQPLLYGFSDGGIVSLLLAIRYPALLSRLAVSGVNTEPAGLKRSFLWLMRVLHFFTQDEKIRLMLHEPHITPEDLGCIQTPTLLLAGEKDIVRVEHTREIARELPGSTLHILPGEDHASYVVHSEKLYPLLLPFFEGAPAV